MFSFPSAVLLGQGLEVPAFRVLWACRLSVDGAGHLPLRNEELFHALGIGGLVEVSFSISLVFFSCCNKSWMLCDVQPEFRSVHKVSFRETLMNW